MILIKAMNEKKKKSTTKRKKEFSGKLKQVNLPTNAFNRDIPPQDLN